MIVLGIETSCDDTSAAIFDGQSLQSNIISTQAIHRQFGGIVPELASRSHTRLILSVIKEALKQSNQQLQHIQGIAVTYGPGLAGSLLVGLSVAKGLALSLQIPFIGINHLEGHIWANRLNHPGIDPPFIVLIASGGHTQLVLVKDWCKYKVLGRTRDDAAGEAYDKIGKLLGIGFPGGPAIEKLARKGNPNYIRFPRAFLKDESLDFSFSGLKTAVLNHTLTIGPEKTKKHLSDIALCFQNAVIDVLVQKSILAAQKNDVQKICLAGGVAVNKSLQQQLNHYAKKEYITVFWPLPMHCTDNAGMIAFVGHDYLERTITSPLTLSPAPSLNL